MGRSCLQAPGEKMIPVDKINESGTEQSNLPTIHMFEKSRNNALARKSGAVVSLDHPAHEGTGSALQFLGSDQTPIQSEPPKPSGGTTGELLLAGSEKLRAEIITKAREADARAREAEERYKQAEARFKQEHALRLLA